ncbi:hypothetical protein LX32DRAFT_108254 [Colletotrichum zoysiae]|uniref:Uncharacterized protein n=1 Tax=Colletotrichum zoysiae TaxID=1216348 RepID=A0AAD9LX55_9PEZI|nr:hypothetical protein LX32DRAFT_108254 [Colletotrichum zoysiae]
MMGPYFIGARQRPTRRSAVVFSAFLAMTAHLWHFASLSCHHVPRRRPCRSCEVMGRGMTTYLRWRNRRFVGVYVMCMWPRLNRSFCQERKKEEEEREKGPLPVTQPKRWGTPSLVQRCGMCGKSDAADADEQAIGRARVTHLLISLPRISIRHGLKPREREREREREMMMVHQEGVESSWTTPPSTYHVCPISYQPA